MATTIHPAALETVLEHARGGRPDEVCGVLAGHRRADGFEVVAAFPTTNAHPNPRTEYLIDPKEQLDVILRVEDEMGLEVVGFYHSHPRGHDRPSKADEAQASWPGALYLLAWYYPTPEDEGYGAWVWRPDDGGFVAEPLTVAEPATDA